jgi:hypothetical protein
MFLGLVIIAVGFIFLLQNLGILVGDIWSILWPILVIIVGLKIAVKRKKTEDKWEKFGENMRKAGEEIKKGFTGKNNEDN